MAEILKFKPKVEVSHGFAIENAINVCNTRSMTTALETIAGDLKFQGGEILKIPLSDEFAYVEKKNPKKLIFECDTETQSDILEVTSKKTRNGKEYPAVAGWRNLLLAENDKSRQEKDPTKKIKTIMQINPMQDKNDPTDKCNYAVAQANIALIDGSDRIRVFQLQFGGNTDTCARLFKLVTQNPNFDPSTIKSVDQMMMSFGVISGRVDQDELLNAVSFVTNKKIPSRAELDRQKAEMSYNAKLGALQFYNEVKMGKSVPELTHLYSRLLGNTMPRSVMQEIRTMQGSSGGMMAMETSCGLVSFFGGGEFSTSPLASLTVKQEKWNYSIGDCIRIGCSEKNVEVGPCAICKKCEKEFDRKSLLIAA